MTLIISTGSVGVTHHGDIPVDIAAGEVAICASIVSFNLVDGKIKQCMFGIYKYTRKSPGWHMCNWCCKYTTKSPGWHVCNWCCKCTRKSPGWHMCNWCCKYTRKSPGWHMQKGSSSIPTISTKSLMYWIPVSPTYISVQTVFLCNHSFSTLLKECLLLP